MAQKSFKYYLTISWRNSDTYHFSISSINFYFNTRLNTNPHKSENRLWYNVCFRLLCSYCCFTYFLEFMSGTSLMQLCTVAYSITFHAYSLLIQWAICICHLQLFLIDCIQSCLRGFCGLLEGIGCRNIFNFHFICCNGQSIKNFSAGRINRIRGGMHGLR